MASGDAVVEIQALTQPTTSYATKDVRLGGSTPAEVLEVYDFDASTIEYLDLKCALHNYDGGGLTVVLPWMASTATSGVARLGVAVRRLVEDAEDVDASHSYSFTDADDTTASASGEQVYTSIAVAHGSLDGWSNGELAVVRIRRNATHANDTMAGDLELLGVIIRET